MLTTKITLVENSSEEQILSAVDFLKQSTFVYLDTRGVNVGYTDGRLSLICLGTFQLEVLHIFIFDTSPVTGLAPTVAPVDSSIDNEPPALPAFKSLFDLLSSEQMTKVMWDGRSDYVEVRDRYGVGVQSIIDLQIVELVSRFEIRTESPTEHFERVAKRFSHRNAGKHNVVTREIHILSPMQEYAQQHNIDIKFGNGKANKLCKKSGQEAWMTRPLADPLFDNATQGIVALAQLHLHFTDLGYIPESDESLKKLKERSLRYLLSQWERGREVSGALFRTRSILPMEVLEPPKKEKAGQIHCAGCGRMLSKASFFLSDKKIKPRQRRIHCKTCYAWACLDFHRKTEESDMQELIDVWHPL